MNTRTWCLSRSCIHNNRSLPLPLARCSAASSTAKTARRIARSARSIGFRIFDMAGLTSVDRPLVVSARPLDLLLYAKDLFVAASTVWHEPPITRRARLARLDHPKVPVMRGMLAASDLSGCTKRFSRASRPRTTRSCGHEQALVFGHPARGKRYHGRNEQKFGADGQVPRPGQSD